VAGVTELKAQFRKGARRTLTKLGPYTIRAAGGKGIGDSTLGGQSFFGTITKGLCNNMNGKKQDCTMLAGRVGVMWSDGRQADPSNGIYIHHILSSDVTKKEKPWFSNCNTPTRASMNVNGLTGGTGFLSTGEDSAAEQAMFTDTAGALNTGYHIKSTDRFNFWAQLVNYNKAPAKVYVTYDIEWVPGIVGQEAKTIVVSATCGAGLIRMSQAGSANTTSGKFYIMEDGRILGGRGHIHDGGVAMHMLINGKYTCSSNAMYGLRSEEASMGGMGGKGGKASHSHAATAPGAKGKGGAEPKLLTVANMTDCVGPFKVKKGEFVQLRAEYDLKKHPLRTSTSGAKAADVMGMMGILFSPGLGPMTMLNGTILN